MHAMLRSLAIDGFLRLPEMLSAAEAEALRARAERLVVDDPSLADYRRTSLARDCTALLVDSDAAPWLAPLMAHGRARAALAAAGISDVRAWKAVIIAKPPRATRMSWHQDCLTWRDGRAYSAQAPLLFLTWYLQDTHAGNGCLRVLPGTHRRNHPLHAVGVAHDEDFYHPGASDPRAADQPGEVAVPARAGDLVVGDGRLLHATHANGSDRWRIAITVWWFPWWSGLHERTRTLIGGMCQAQHRGWSAATRAELGALWPTETGEAGDAGEAWATRTPARERLLPDSAPAPGA